MDETAGDIVVFVYGSHFNLFHIAASRSRNILEKWVGPEFAGYLNLGHHGRMWSVIATCKKQNRSFFHFLVDSIAAQLNQIPGPSLLNP